MLLTEYNEAETLEMFKRDYLAEGRAEGRTEGINTGMVIAYANLVADGTFTAEQAAKKLGMTEEAFEEAVQALNVKS